MKGELREKCVVNILLSQVCLLSYHWSWGRETTGTGKRKWARRTCQLPLLLSRAHALLLLLLLLPHMIRVRQPTFAQLASPGKLWLLLPPLVWSCSAFLQIVPSLLESRILLRHLKSVRSLILVVDQPLVAQTELALVQPWGFGS